MCCPIEAGNDAEMLVALAAGRLTTAEREAFELHMSGCAECRRRAEAQRSVWGALDAWTPPDVTAGFDSRLFARIAAEERLPWWQRGWSLSWKPMLPVGAACVALMGVFLIHDPWSSAGAPAVPAAIVQTQEDAQKVDVDQVERTLDDMDMLNQLDTPASPPRAPAGS